MQHRVFGRELTNLLDRDHLRYKRNYSLLHQDKLKDLKAPISTRNKSIVVPHHKHSPPKQDQPDPQMVPEYIEQNFRFLIDQEKTHPPLGNYISTHRTVSQSSRAKLIDWLCELHYKYKMFPETIFTIVTLVDRYLSAKSVPLSELQLVGVAALYIAAKFQETYQVPQVKHLTRACAEQYSKSQVLATEADIVSVLNFDLIVNSVYKFYQPLAKLAGLESKNVHLGHYVLQLAMTRPKLLQYSPSLLACSCIYLIKKIRKCSSAWSESLTKLVGYEEGDLKSCAKDLCCLLQESGGLENCKAIKKKFSLPEYDEVTRIKLERKEQRR